MCDGAGDVGAGVAVGAAGSAGSRTFEAAGGASPVIRLPLVERAARYGTPIEAPNIDTMISGRDDMLPRLDRKALVPDHLRPLFEDRLPAAPP